MPTTLLRFVRVLAAVVGALSLGTACHAGTDHDRWSTVEMMGQRAGWMHEWAQTEGERITSGSKMEISVARGVAPISISIETVFVESADGKPISMASTKKTGATPMTERYLFKDDGTVELVTEQGGMEQSKTLPKPDGVWLTPAASDRYVLQRFKSGAKEIKVRSIDPSQGLTPLTVTRTGFTPATIEVNGKKIEGTKVTVQNSVNPSVKSTDYIDAEGDTIKSETKLGIFAMTVTSSTKEAALADAKPPEIMLNTFIKPDRAIEDARHTTKTVLLLSVPDDVFPTLPETGAQKVEKVDATSARLTITSVNPTPAPEGDAADPALLRSTAMANIEDERVKELAKQAVASARPGDEARAEACRRFVYRFIKKKNMDVAFASASEVARRKEGDCTEHGVLLTALLRANGIPARAATGLIYADEFEGQGHIFGYHMWAQALLTIEGRPRWVDLDATLPRTTPFDATHITLSTTNLADGESDAGLANLAALLGRLKIKVEAAE